MKPREKIKELRKNPKISQQGLANKLNVPVDHIKSFESGKQKVISDELALALEKEYNKKAVAHAEKIFIFIDDFILLRRYQRLGYYDRFKFPGQ